MAHLRCTDAGHHSAADGRVFAGIAAIPEL